MSLVYADGFEHQDPNNGNSGPYFQEPDGYGTNVRHGAGVTTATHHCITYTNSDISVALNSDDHDSTIITGFAWYADRDTLFNGQDFCRFYGLSGGDYRLQMLAEMTSDGRVRIKRGDGTILATSASAGIITTRSWYYVEFKAFMDNTTGSAEVRINGTSVVSVSGVDTLQDTGYENIGRVHIGGDRHADWLDDWYICNAQGGVNDDFLGDVVVETLMPDGNGTYSEWVGSDADSTDNYLLMDEQPPNDADYVESSTLNNRDTYTLDNMIGTGTVHGICVAARMQKDDSGTREGAVMIRSGTTDAVGDSTVLGVGWRVPFDTWDVNPDDAAAFTSTDINSLEAGVKVTV